MRTVMALLVLVALSGCSGGDDPNPEPTADPTKQAAGPALPEGVAVPEALSNFTCSENDKGVWKATGVVSNAGKNAEDFQVTVFIGEPGEGRGKARTIPLAQIGGGESSPWKVAKVPAPGNGGTCNVQVLRLK